VLKPRVNTLGEHTQTPGSHSKHLIHSTLARGVELESNPDTLDELKHALRCSGAMKIRTCWSCPGSLCHMDTPNTQVSLRTSGKEPQMWITGWGGSGQGVVENTLLENIWNEMLRGDWLGIRLAPHPQVS
jgi:hypothetical protein